MPDLIICEFQKLKRKKFIMFATIAAFIFPIPMTVFAIKQSWSYDQLYYIILLFGHFVLLIPVLCIVATMLLFMERDNSTMKNLLSIPVSKNKLVISKLCILLFVSILYATGAMIASLIGAAIVNVPVSGILYKLFLSIVLAVMTMVASLPCIAIIVWCNKNYIISLIISFLYTVISFVLGVNPVESPGFNLSTILPVGMITRWLIPRIKGGHLGRNTINQISVSSPECIVFLVLVATICIFLIIRAYKCQEN